MLDHANVVYLIIKKKKIAEAKAMQVYSENNFTYCDILLDWKHINHFNPE